MDKLITIVIVSNRFDCLQTCLERLKWLPGRDLVKIHVYIDGKTSNMTIHQVCTQMHVEGVSVQMANDFIEARNRCVSECDTEYMFILDDDDYLSTDSIYVLYDAIEKSNHADFISTLLRKEGRVFYITENLQPIYDKYNWLNNFDEYGDGLRPKVYLNNGGNLIKTSLLRKCPEYKYLGCDDILPISAAYIIAESAWKLSKVLYYYPNQNTIGSKKSPEKLRQLEDNIYNSYQDLIKYLRTAHKLEDKSVNDILKLAIYNSMRQLQFLDNYMPTKLMELTW